MRSEQPEWWRMAFGGCLNVVLVFCLVAVLGFAVQMRVERDRALQAMLKAQADYRTVAAACEAAQDQVTRLEYTLKQERMRQPYQPMGDWSGWGALR